MFYFLFYYLQYVQFKRMAVNNFNAFGLIRRKNTLFSVFFMFLKRKKKIWKFFIWFRFFVKWASLQKTKDSPLSRKVDEKYEEENCFHFTSYRRVSSSRTLHVQKWRTNIDQYPFIWIILNFLHVHTEDMS